jgi:hypothetical protein
MRTKSVLMENETEKIIVPIHVGTEMLTVGFL